MVRKIKGYIEYRGSGKWPIAKANFPAILSVCDSQAVQQRVQKYITASLKANWRDDITFALTTTEALRSGEKGIWHLIKRPDDLVSLEEVG